MGIILSRFRKSKTTIETLEEIDDNIEKLEKFKRDNNLVKLKVIKKVCMTLIVLYLIALAYLYCMYLYYKTCPVEWMWRIICLAVIVVPPLLTYKVKHFIDYYYNRQSNKKDKQLKKLIDDRKEILENVMDTETYKVAKKILEKFCPETKKKIKDEQDRLNNSVQSPKVNPNSTPNSLRNRKGQPVVMTQEVNRSVMQRPNPMSPMIGANGLRQQASLPCPLPKRNRGTIDRVLEYVIGDGPNNRYALICVNCYAHNGMALKEEFEYKAFRCAYCGFFNKARKQKPGAPVLPHLQRFTPAPPQKPQIKSPQPQPQIKFRNNMSYSVVKPADSASEVSTSGRSSAKINELSDASDEEKDKKLEEVAREALKSDEEVVEEEIVVEEVVEGVVENVGGSQVEEFQESDSSSIVELENAEIQSGEPQIDLKKENEEDKKTK